jgi:hypothetical protein
MSWRCDGNAEARMRLQSQLAHGIFQSFRAIGSVG